MSRRFGLTHYEVLNVRVEDDADTIRRAYHRLARDLHPDMHPSDPHAEEAMRLVNQAWSVLGDRERRRAYDHELARIAFGIIREAPVDEYETVSNVSPHNPLRVSFAAIMIIVLLAIAMITPYLGRT
jgi:curved DNA-binding protein CbpA